MTPRSIKRSDTTDQETMPFKRKLKLHNERERILKLDKEVRMLKLDKEEEEIETRDQQEANPNQNSIKQTANKIIEMTRLYKNIPTKNQTNNQDKRPASNTQSMTSISRRKN